MFGHCPTLRASRLGRWIATVLGACNRTCHGFASGAPNVPSEGTLVFGWFIAPPDAAKTNMGDSYLFGLTRRNNAR